MGTANQVATSVTALTDGLSGHNSVSLDSMTGSSVPTVLTGSCLEVVGALFRWDSDETPTASTWTSIATGSTVYMQCTPSGSAGSQILTTSYTTTVPAWRSDHHGWYGSAASSVRHIARLTKGGAISYQNKKKLFPSGSITLDSSIVDIASAATVILSGTTTVSGTIISIDVNGGAIDGTPIGAATPSTGVFTKITGPKLVKGSLHGNTVTHNTIFDTMSPDIATGETILVSGAMTYSSANDLIVINRAQRTISTRIQLSGYGLNGGSYALFQQDFDDGVATAVDHISIAW